MHYHQRKKTIIITSSMCARPKKRSVISRRLYVDPLHPSTTVAQPDWSSLMDLLVQSWFHTGWPHPQLQTIAHPSAHPNSAFEWALFKKCVCCAEYGIPPPCQKASNMCKSHSVSAVELSERPAWQLWCDSHRTGTGTTPGKDPSHSFGGWLPELTAD